jgi:hypothetical protein
MIFWSKGIKSIFGYEKTSGWRQFKGGFDNIPETASKCLLNYILYRTKPTIGKMNTALNVLTTPINTYLTGFLLKRKKAIRMIEASKISQSKRRRAAT